MPSSRRLPLATPAPALVEGLRSLAGEGELEVTVRGGCMAPLLPDGTRVGVVPARVYWPGDVLVFRGEDGLLRAHRLLGYRFVGGKLAGVTRGDAGGGRDAPVLLSRVVGRVDRAPGGALLGSPRARLRAALAFLALAARRLAGR